MRPSPVLLQKRQRGRRGGVVAGDVVVEQNPVLAEDVAGHRACPPAATAERMASVLWLRSQAAHEVRALVREGPR
jgi:hypothetical protein